MKRMGATGKERPVLSYAYGNGERSLILTAERRAPYVTVRQLLLAGVESGVIKYNATLLYDIRYSAVESLRVDVPAGQAESVRLTTPGLRREVTDEAEIEAGYVAWRIAGEAEFFGDVRVELQWEDKAVSEGAMAFEFHDAWGLSVQATRYEAKEVKATSVERALVRAVLTRGKVTNVQALFRVLSARQRLGVELPHDAVFDSQPLRLNGRPVALEQGEEQQSFIPLVSIEQGEPFLLELRLFPPAEGLGVARPGISPVATVLIVWALWYLLFILPKSPFSEAFRKLIEEKRSARAAGPPAVKPPNVQPGRKKDDAEESPTGPEGIEDE